MKLILSGKAFDVAEGGSAGELLKTLCPDDVKKYYAVRLTDGTLRDLYSPLSGEGEAAALTFEDEDGRKVYRHSCSHLMAMAVKSLYPEAKLAIGPAIENGFYYDFDVPQPFSPDDLPKIEKEMEHIARKSIRPRRYTLPRPEAIAMMKDKGEPYKVQLIEDLPENETLSFYEMGDFTDLCVGPHLPNMS